MSNITTCLWRSAGFAPASLAVYIGVINMNKSPNIEELLGCGVSLAEELGMEVPPQEMFNTKINEILFDRENYECAKSGLITSEELVNLVMAHFETLVCNYSCKEEPSELKLSAVLRSRFQSALLG